MTVDSGQYLGELVRLVNLICIPFLTLYYKKQLDKINEVLQVKQECEGCKRSAKIRNSFIDKQLGYNREDHKNIQDRLNDLSDQIHGQGHSKKHGITLHTEDTPDEGDDQ